MTPESITWFTNHDDLVTVYERTRLRRRWYYRVQAGNGEIGDVGEGYVRRIDAVTAAERHHPHLEDGEQ